MGLKHFTKCPVPHPAEESPFRQSQVQMKRIKIHSERKIVLKNKIIVVNVFLAMSIFLAFCPAATSPRAGSGAGGDKGE